ncbi:MAG: hypothetical protein LBC68_06410 [Prevotellaceae bacterium]|nr:hypothetical protein [Prevotellaceae bacterium]
MLVEKQGASCISRGLPAVFQVSDSAPRERHTQRFSTNISFLRNGNL